MKKKYTWLFIIILICLGAFIVPRILQNDTFYTIKIGNYILEHGIDMKDHFSGISNLSYTYPHWLFDTLIGITYKYTGFTGLYFLTIGLTSLLAVSLYTLLKKIFKEKLVTFVISFIVTLLMTPFITLRAQLLTYTCFILIIYNIIMFLENKKIKHTIFIYLISVLIANFHAAVWPLVLVLFLPYLVEYPCYLLSTKIKLPKVIKNKIEFKNEKNIKYLFILFLITITSGLLTPIGLTPYTYTIKTFLGTSTSLIGEHSTSVLDSTFFMFVLVIPLIIFLLFGKKKRLADFFMLSGLLILSIMSRRHVALLLTIGSFYIFKYIYRKINKYEEEYNWLESLLFKPLVKLIILAIFIVPYIPLFIHNYNSPSVDPKNYPNEAADFLLKRYDANDIVVFNDYNYGAYLMYRDILPHIDSRCDLYTYPFNKKFDYFNKYIDLDKNFYQNYHEYFNEYNINTIVLKHDSYLTLYLYKDCRYHPIYLDQNFVIFRTIK